VSSDEKTLEPETDVDFEKEKENVLPKESTVVVTPPPVEEEHPLLLPVAYDPWERYSKVNKVAPASEAPQVVEEQKVMGAAPQIESVLPDIDDKTIPSKALDAESTLQTTLPILEIAEPTPEYTAPIVEQPPLPIKAEAKEWKVPRSKFSVQDLKKPEVVPEIPKEPLPTTTLQLDVKMEPKSPVGSTFSNETKRSLTEDDGEVEHSSKRKKRRGLVEPIRTDLDVTDRSAANSEANFSSDDDLMDELQSAVFQDAQPISVSKSPISPVFPSPKKWNDGNRFTRAFSGPLRSQKIDSKLLEAPSQPQLQTQPSRSVSASAAYLNKINQQPTKPMATKVNLGSGISQRIKALEKLSSLAPGTNSAPGATGSTTGTSTSFFSVRKGSVRGSSRSPSIAERANSLTRNTPDPSPTVSRESSPEAFKLRDRSGSIQNRVNAFKSDPIPNQPPRARPESISVTARIIRDPAQPFPPKSEAGKNPSEYAPLDLKQSPLVIDHKKAVVEPPKETILERRQSKERRLSKASATTSTTTRERRSSITIIKDMINDTRTSFSERRRSINLEVSSPSVKSPSVRSPSRPPSVHASPSHNKPMSISSRLSISSRDVNGLSPPPTAGTSSSSSDEKTDKKSTRASRMLRRMSSSLSASRKNISHAMSPTVREESEPANDSRS